MKASGQMTRRMVQEPTYIAMGVFMLETGSTTSKRGMVKNRGLIVPAMRDNMKMERRMVLVTLNGLMEVTTMVILLKITWKATGPTDGAMEEHM